MVQGYCSGLDADACGTRWVGLLPSGRWFFLLPQEGLHLVLDLREEL